MWPPHTNSRVPERERRLRVWLAASMIAMVDDPPGGCGWRRQIWTRRSARWRAPPSGSACRSLRQGPSSARTLSFVWKRARGCISARLSQSARRLSWPDLSSLTRMAEVPACGFGGETPRAGGRELSAPALVSHCLVAQRKRGGPSARFRSTIPRRGVAANQRPPVQPNKASSTDERQPDLRAIVAATMAELSQGPKTFGPIDLGAPRILQA